MQMNDQARLPSEMTGAPKIPRQFAPLLRNEWYVIADRRDVDRSLKSITVLGDPLVYYRTQAGDAVVLIDRCAHRFYPLSKSCLEGDAIRCGYHGFKYGPDGKCIDIPGDFGKPNFGVRRYPAVERGPWLWVWMGDADLADESAIPMEDVPDDWSVIGGYILNPCNYMLVHENLLDLTHVYFLHGPSFIDEATNNTLPKQITVEGGVGTRTESVRQGAYAVTDRLIKSVSETSVTASLWRGMGSISPMDDNPEPIRPSRTLTCHAITPRDLLSTHQFWTYAVDVAGTDQEELRKTLQEVAFPQDVEAVAAQMEAILNSNGEELKEHRLAADALSVKMHRILIRRGVAEEERKKAMRKN